MKLCPPVNLAPSGQCQSVAGSRSCQCPTLSCNRSSDIEGTGASASQTPGNGVSSPSTQAPPASLPCLKVSRSSRTPWKPLQCHQCPQVSRWLQCPCWQPHTYCKRLNLLMFNKHLSHPEGEHPRLTPEATDPPGFPMAHLCGWFSACMAHCLLGFVC